MNSQYNGGQDVISCCSYMG